MESLLRTCRCSVLVVCVSLLGGTFSFAAEPGTGATPAGAGIGPAGADSLTLTLEQAVLSALERNTGVNVERFTADINRTYEQQAQAQFDPKLQASVSRSRLVSDVNGSGFGPTTQYVDDSLQGEVGVTRYLPTGTTLVIGAAAQEGKATSSYPAASTRIGLTVTQALLQGSGLGPNLARVTEAKLTTLRSEYSFRGYLEALVAQVEESYWDYALLLRQVATYQESLGLADRQLQETRKRIEVGVTAPTELPAAEAEVAQRKAALINAQGDVDLARLRLIRVINPRGASPWTRPLTLLDSPDQVDVAVEAPENHVAVALRMRPEMNEARLQIRQGNVEIVRTKSGLLPKLDAFLTLGPTGYASSFLDTFHKFDEARYDAAVGLQLTYPLGKRDEKAAHRRAVLQLDQAREALANLGQLVELDVRSGLIEIARAQEQMTANAALRRLRAESLRVEEEKFKNGKSTSLLVAQAQRDFLASQVAEIAASASFRKAIVRFYRAEGSLLQRRRLAAPGTEPIEAPDDSETK